MTTPSKRNATINKQIIIFVFIVILSLVVYIFAPIKSKETPSDQSFGINESIEKAVRYLENQQETSGDFPSKVCNTLKKERCNIHLDSTFSTTFVVYSLDLSPENETAKKLSKKGTDFIINQKSDDDLWRFWGDKIDYDLDAISCAAYLLDSKGHTLKNRETLYNNRDSTGVFKTWIRDKEKNDLEGVVNANVLLYLGENERTIPACEWILSAIKNGTENDILFYYPESPILFYTLSRAYKAHNFNCIKKELPLLRSKIKKVLPIYGNKKDYLNVAFLLNALLNFEGRPQEVLGYTSFFIENQNSDGSWNESLFFVGVEPPAQPSSYFYSDAVTTALVFEFLGKAHTIISKQ